MIGWNLIFQKYGIFKSFCTQNQLFVVKLYLAAEFQLILLHSKQKSNLRVFFRKL